MAKRIVYTKEKYRGTEIKVYIDEHGYFHPNIRGKRIHKRYEFSSDAIVDAKTVIRERKE